MWKCDEPRPSEVQSELVGLGTCIAFVGSSCIAVASLLIRYLFIHKPRTLVDVVVLTRFRESGGLGKHCEDSNLASLLDEYILRMSDIQMCLGLAVLLYGFVSLSQGISAYHWCIIVGFGWMSVVTNLAALSHLREHLVHHSGKQRWRLVFLSCLIATLSVAMVPTIRMKDAFANDAPYKHDVLLTNVLCFFPGYGSKSYGDRRGNSPMFACSLAVFCIFIGLILHGALNLCEGSQSVLLNWCKEYRSEMLGELREDPTRGPEICYRCDRRYTLLVKRPFIAYWLVLRVYADLLGSILTEIFCIFSLAVWVFLRFFSILDTTSLDMNWKLGQIIMLVLFATPFEALAEILCGVQWRAIRIRSPRFLVLQWLESARLKALEKAQRINQSNRSHLDASQGRINQVACQENQKDKLRNECCSTGANRDIAKVIAIDWYFLSPWFTTALPMVGFSSLAYIMVLFILPTLGAVQSPADALVITMGRCIIYQPLLIFAFFLGSMVVEERTKIQGKASTTYRTISATATGLSLVGIVDTIFGFGGSLVSYFELGVFLLYILVYLLYGCVARPSRQAKGKSVDRSYMGDNAVEEARPLLRSNTLQSDISFRTSRSTQYVRFVRPPHRPAWAPSPRRPTCRSYGTT